jgi:hypothetical protein
MLRLLEDSRLLPALLALGWAAFYGSVAASNATEVLTALGVTVGWRSGNVAYVQSGLVLLGKPPGMAVAVVVLATLVQSLSAALYLRAVGKVVKKDAGAIPALRAATVPGVALWFLFVVGIEVLLAFEKLDWRKFLALIVAALVSQAVSELVLRDDRPRR